MKKLIIFIFISAFIFLALVLIYRKTNISNSEAYEGNKQISTLIEGYSSEYNHVFKLATKEIEQILYDKWKVADTLGYSLKYDTTGSSLDNGTIDLSKTHFIKLTQNGSMYEYKNPVLVYYNETLEQMAKDDLLGNYSGVEGLKSDTMGTVVIVMAISPDSTNEYDYISTKLLLINDNVIAVDMYSFYKLQKFDN